MHTIVACNESKGTIKTETYEVKIEDITDTVPEAVGKECDLNSTENIIMRKRIKRPSKPFCDYCNVSFKNFDEYKEHRKSIKHPRSKIHQCPHCSKKFITNFHLINHIRVHTNERPFSCELCSAKFANECNLKRHAKVHTDEKPHSCEICTKCTYFLHFQ